MCSPYCLREMSYVWLLRALVLLVMDERGGESKFSAFWVCLKIPPASPLEPLLTLLRAKIESKFTRPQVTLRLSNSRAI